MGKLSHDRLGRLRMTIAILIQRGTPARGTQIMLARHFGVSRQRIHQLWKDVMHEHPAALEAARASGRPTPRDAEKSEHGEAAG